MTSNGSVSSEKDEGLSGEKMRELKSLRPHHESEQHDMYVEALKQAVRQREVTNIALSGPYGVGKSSILQGFRKHHPDAIFISLSTLGFSEPTESKSTQSSDGAISPQTNQIQKEIVKQLLYRKPPNKLPASQFRRIQKFDWKHFLPVSALIGLVLTVIIAVIGGFAKIPKVRNSSWCDFGIKFAGVWLLMLIATEVASHLLQGKVRFDKLTAGPATVTLSQESDSYFDRYLDEIIYFFEMSTCRVVVFEDIDRFSNWQIFEELRELNTILNNAEQLQDKKSKSDKNKIVFVYAMKDSIFEPQTVTDTGEVAKGTHDRAIQEIQRANRTKFFDVIIPVVPFVTHRSARDLMRQELEGIQPKISDKLIDHVAKYVPDFRLLRSVCNEYTIYAQFILGDNKLKLEPDNLFALMIYKSVHLKDFETIHLGQSKLDEVYQMSLLVIENRISAVNEKYDILEKQLDPNVEAEMRGKEFRRMIEWLAARYRMRVDSFTVNLDSQAFSSEGTRTPMFWSAVSRLSDTDSMIVMESYNQYGNPMPLEITKQDMALIMGHDLVFTSIDERPRNVIGSELHQLDVVRQQYQSAHMSDLMSDPLAVVPSENGAEQTFSAYVEKTLGSKLAAALIRHGYIDQNFVLYTSTYHTTSLSANAMTFRLQHMERGVTNTNYELSDNDVLQLISDTTIDLEEFARPGAYNVSILDYLLANGSTHREHLDLIMLSFLQDDDGTKHYLQSFFSSDSLNKDRLVIELTPRYPGIFTLLVGLRGIPDEKQVNYVNIALQCASPDVDYDTSSLKSFVEVSYCNMTVFTSTYTDKPADTVATLMAQADVKFSNINQIDSKLCEYLIENWCYEVNHHNLEFVSGDNQVALDVLSRKRPSVYAYLLRSLEAYFAIIADDESGRLSALVGSADTAKVIVDVVKLDVAANTISDDLVADDAKLGDGQPFPLLSNLLASSGGDWSIDLDGLPSSCWPILAAHDRLAVTTSNLWLYVSKHGVDDALIELLERHSSIENQDDALSNDEYIELATVILNLKEEQISAKQRVALVASMDHGEPIPASRITPQEDGLVGLLIKAGLIDDNSDAYRLVSNLEWPNREFAIASSQRFADYMDTSLVGNDVLAIVQSQLVSTKVKQNIINSISSYCYGMNVEDLTSLAKYAASQQDLTVDGDALIWLLDQGVKPNVVVPLLVTGLDSLSDFDVRNIVMALGQPYSDLLEKGVSRVHVDEIMGVDRLLERLKDVGEVTTYTKDGRKRRYAVYRHRGPKP
ncbi:YobI family P-loop NTPase [Actinomyces sp. oral taxon 849]|uniref:YobI family P-loop NTPase n=1 Tax=Actinomyces sp. oral taxon 849 TaxID=653385 RepID=UPI00031954AE|nr:hypothetical protein [Actinomyces sp. oral taxon 849]